MNPDRRSSPGRTLRGKASPSVTPYLITLSLQSIAALAITAAVYRAFQIIIDDLGALHAIRLIDLIMLLASIAVFQASYWSRLAGIDIPEWRNVIVGHIVGFLGRLSFIFGGAFFSLFFLRHAPYLISTASGANLIVRIIILLAALFCLYCFTLELERLASILQLSKTGNRPSGAEDDPP